MTDVQTDLWGNLGRENESPFFFFFLIGESGFVNLLFYFHIFLYVNVLQESQFYIDYKYLNKITYSLKKKKPPQTTSS